MATFTWLPWLPEGGQVDVLEAVLPQLPVGAVGDPLLVLAPLLVLLALEEVGGPVLPDPLPLRSRLTLDLGGGGEGGDRLEGEIANFFSFVPTIMVIKISRTAKINLVRVIATDISAGHQIIK